MSQLPDIIELKEFWYTFTDWNYETYVRSYPKKFWFYKDGFEGSHEFWRLAHTCKYGYGNLFKDESLFQLEKDCQDACDKYNQAADEIFRKNNEQQNS